jgi:hypothetical protein
MGWATSGRDRIERRHHGADGTTLTNQRVMVAEKLGEEEYQTVAGVLGAPFFQQSVTSITTEAPDLRD